MSRRFRAEIRENRPLNDNHGLLSLINLDAMDEAVPGQFFMLGVSRNYDPLLKRAFSLFRRTSYGFQILYRVLGKGTSILKDMKEGAVLDLLGPLGNGYPYPAGEQIPLIVAGGIGMASVFPLIEALPGSAYVFYGAKTRGELFAVDEIEKLSRELFISTDDGTCEKKGSVIDSLIHFLNRRQTLHKRLVIYSCGPKPVLREVSKIALSMGLDAYVSLEEHMACGIGACLGCVAKVRRPGGRGEVFRYSRVCKEGPVFEARDILW